MNKRKIIRAFIFVLAFFFCLKANAQLKLSATGAMAALNGSTSPIPVNATISPVVTITNIPTGTTPSPNPNIVGAKYVLPNDRTISFAYQSALAWWSGNLDYKAAAQSLRLSGDLLQISVAMAAAVFILSDNSFTPLQNYNQRRTTMIIRANDQSPVHFPLVQNINGADVQFNAYTPTVSSLNIVVPIKF